MNKEFKAELERIECKMVECESFAKKLPFLSDEIINNKYTGNEHWINFSRNYKDLPLKWVLQRGLFASDSRRTITNYKGSYTEFLFCLHINTYSFFEHHEDFDLNLVAKKCDLFFYDKINSTFYATDSQVEILLDELVVWFLKACEENTVWMREKRVKKLKEKKEQIRIELKQIEADLLKEQ